MIGFVIRKILYAVATLFVVASLTFFLMKLLPGDPFSQEQAIPEEIQVALRDHYKLNDHWTAQYARYLYSVLTWDLGPSFQYSDRTVNEIINESFPISALLGLEALTFAIPLGLFMGTVAALKANRWQDKGVFLWSVVAMSTPNFVLASFLQYTLGFKLALFPMARWGSFAHTILPVFALAMLPSVFIARLTRSSILEVLQQDYIKTAKAKGLPDRLILMKHIARNALLPILPYIGQLTANILVGSFVIEKVFSIPGLGQWFVNSVGNRDYTVIMGLTVFYTMILLFMLLLVDLIYGWIDPRVRLKSQHS